MGIAVRLGLTTPKWLAFVVVPPLVLSVNAFAQNANQTHPSFSCRGNLVPTEVVICSDAELVSLDQHLTAAYNSKLSSLQTDQRVQLAAAEKAWLAERNRCRADRLCIFDAYWTRITSLGGPHHSTTTMSAPNNQSGLQIAPLIAVEHPSVSAQSSELPELNAIVPAGAVCPAAMLRPDVQELGHAKISDMKDYWETTSPSEIIKYGNIVSVVPVNTDGNGIEILPLRPDQRAFVRPLAIAGQLFHNMWTVYAHNDQERDADAALGSVNGNRALLFVCFPELKELVLFAKQRLTPESLNSAQVAEARRQREEQINDRKPEHILVRAYAEYVYLKKCYDRRQGYLAVNLSEEELKRGRAAARAIEQKMIEADASLDNEKDALWRQANGEDGDWQTDRDKTFFLLLLTMQSDRDRCQFVLHDLDEGYKALVPDAKSVKKDF